MGCEFEKDEFECSIVSLKGDACTLTVQQKWSVARLKECIEDEMGIPCYMQVLSDADRKLRNMDVIYELWSAQHCVGARPSLFLLCENIPDNFSYVEAQRVWEAFRISSADLGDTINKTDLPDVFRFIGYSAYDFQLEALSTKSESLSFVDVLSLITEWKTRYYEKEPSDSVEECCVPEISYPYDLSDAQLERDFAMHLQKLQRLRRKARARTGTTTQLQSICWLLVDENVRAEMPTVSSIDCQPRSHTKLSL
eukprot:TRINITY_DN10202_c0_g1_i1.p1 TRINITY_DN10202_c0_g1~~TRINITY_DN10202_c0_g1_i1.p1  ORF type:complete len:291 (+),score=27.17 TRINITY_DN10202_c0_g1_i1:115-873(+)